MVFLSKGKNWNQTHTQRKDDVMRHREDSHLPAPERDLEQISPFTVPGRYQPCQYLILDFSSAELCTANFYCRSPPVAVRCYSSLRMNAGRASPWPCLVPALAWFLPWGRWRLSLSPKCLSHCDAGPLRTPWHNLLHWEGSEGWKNLVGHQESEVSRSVLGR